MARTGRGAVDQDADWTYHYVFERQVGEIIDPQLDVLNFIPGQSNGGGLPTFPSLAQPIYYDVNNAYGGITVWDRGVISFGAPTSEQISFMAGVDVTKNLNGFPGDHISVGYQENNFSIDVGVKPYLVQVKFDQASVIIYPERIEIQGPGGGYYVGGINIPVSQGQENIDIDRRTLFVRDGGTGPDTIQASDAPQTINGLAGNDVLLGGEGAVILRGGAGNDTLTGSRWADILEGGDNDDTVNAGPGDTASGGAGTDTLNFDFSREAGQVVFTIPDTPGENDYDITYSLFESYWATGTAFNDRLTGNKGDNKLFGGAGVDILIGGAGNDVLDAGIGGPAAPPPIQIRPFFIFDPFAIDDYFFRSSPGTVPTATIRTKIPNPQTNSDRQYSFNAAAGAKLSIDVDNANDVAPITVAVFGPNGQLNLTRTVPGPDKEGLYIETTLAAAGNYVVEIITDSGIVGAFDTIISLTSANPPTVNKLTGGTGNDTYYVYAASDQVIELNGEGTDTVISTVGLTIPDFVEVLQLAGAEAIDAVGSARAETLTGNGADNRLTGLGGNDTIDGGGGIDTAVYSGNRASYVVSKEGVNYRIVDQRAGANDGSDLLINVEFLQFADTKIAVAQGLPNVAPVAVADSAFTVTGVPVVIAVLANDTDPNGDAVTITKAGDPPHGTAAINENGTITYTPDAGYNGKDSFSYTIADGRGGSATQAVSVSTSATPEAGAWRLFAGDGFVAQLGGSGQVFGTAGVQDITVLDEAGRVLFDPSFNRGGDIVRLSADAADWQAVRSGSTVLFSDGDTFVQLPIGEAGTFVVFDDGVRTLKVDAGVIKIGSQAVSTTFAEIAAPAEAAALPGGTSADVAGRLFLATGASLTAGGRIDVFGTAGAEELSLLSGDIRLDPSFNRGGDTITLASPAKDFIAVRSGSSLLLDNGVLEVSIPVGTANTLVFAGNDERVLVSSGGLLLGNQVIGTTPVALSEFA